MHIANTGAAECALEAIYRPVGRGRLGGLPYKL